MIFYTGKTISEILVWLFLVHMFYYGSYTQVCFLFLNLIRDVMI